MGLCILSQPIWGRRGKRFRQYSTHKNHSKYTVPFYCKKYINSFLLSIKLCFLPIIHSGQQINILFKPIFTFLIITFGLSLFKNSERFILGIIINMAYIRNSNNIFNQIQGFIYNICLLFYHREHRDRLLLLWTVF